MTTQQITKRIAEIQAAGDECIGHDEGTHGTRINHSIYVRIDGTQYAVRSGAGSSSLCSVEDANANSAGRIRMSPDAISRAASARRELAELQKALRAAS